MGAAEATRDTPDAAAVRAEVQAWLGDEWDSDRPHAEWVAALVDAGYAAPSWPREWFGRGLAPELSSVVAEELRRAGAPGGGRDLTDLAGNTILAHGSDELKRRALRPLLTGDATWCLLYSEPGAGSDLAAVQTRAERDGDEWVVNGQKVWTSFAHTATYGLLIARTNWDVPKHLGITYFYLPMRQPGVDVRPLRQITGGAHFNEVFFTDARVSDADRIGDVDAGWRVLQTALAYERVLLGGSEQSVDSIAGRDSKPGSAIDPDRAANVAGTADPVALARRLGRDRDPSVRQAIAHLYSLRMVNQWTTSRGKAELERNKSSSAASLSKLAMSDILHTAARVSAHILGAESMLDGPDNPDAASVNRAALTAFVNSIGGGTDQIQRNILGERVLGLPREPQVDRDIPFRDVRKADAIRQLG
jgi:alkylation response protein AidB-like acyl-CoA dehydrogenase